MYFVDWITENKFGANRCEINFLNDFRLVKEKKAF